VAETAEHAQGELTRRHRAAVRAVVGVLVSIVVLVALALSGALGTAASQNPLLVGALRIGIFFFGVGAIAYRRTRFSAMRLQDIAGLRGASGLLETLQRTTVNVALIGGAIALMGFALHLLTGVWTEMVWAAVVAFAVIFYAYPRRDAWRRVVEATEQNGEGPTRAAKGTIA
jgi:hypothetical protein